MESKIAVGETAYTANGEKVFVIALAPNGFVVSSFYNTEDDEEYYDSDCSWFCKSLFKSAPTKALDTEIARLKAECEQERKELQTLRSEKDRLQREKASNREKFPISDILTQLADGKYTHFVSKEAYRAPRIGTVEELQKVDGDNRTLFWVGYNRGESRLTVQEHYTFYASYEEAREAVRTQYEAKIAKGEWIAEALHYGFDVPAGTQIAILEQRKRNTLSQNAYHKKSWDEACASVSKIEAEIAKLQAEADSN